MKIKKSGSKYNYDLQLKSYAPLSFRLYFYVACFMFLSFRLLSSLTGTVYANSAADHGNKLSQSSVMVPMDPNTVKGFELLRTGISIAEGQKDTRSKDQLRKIIEQVRSVEFKPQEQVPEPVIVPEKAPVIEPNEIVPDVPEHKEEAKQEAKPKLPDETITDETLQKLRNIAQEPEKLDNPLELGEILFVSGNVKEAVTFYSEALKRKDPNDVNLSWDRAWILFQIGNCLRKDDLPAAAKMYRQLLTEYPNSPWADFATAQSNLITWYLKDEPYKLMLQIKHTGSEQ